MGHLRTRACGREGGQPGIPEQIENSNRARRFLDRFLDKSPMGSRLGKDAEMTPGRRHYPKSERSVAHFPALRNFPPERPTTTALFIRRLEGSIGPIPLFLGKSPLPHRLGFRTDECIRAEPFKLLTITTIE